MKVSTLSIISFFTLPFLGHAVVKSGYSFQGASAYGSWNIASEDFCSWGYAWISASEGTTTIKSQGKPVGTEIHDVYFDYSLDNTCTQTSTYGYASASLTGDIAVNLKKASLGTTVSVDLQGWQTTYSWSDWENWTQEPLSLSVDAAWNACTLMNSGKSMSKYNTPFSKYMYKSADKYADACTLDVTVTGGVALPFDPTTSYGSLFEGKNMEWYMEKKN